MTRYLVWTMTSLMLLSLSACSNEQPGEGYFPLDSGLKWTYRIKEESKLGKEKRMVWMRNMGETRFRDKDYFIRRNSFGTDYYLSKTDRGIFRIGKRTLAEYKPRLDDEPRQVMKFPLALEVEWQLESHPFLIHRLSPYELIREEVQVRMSYWVDELHETVKVPAGTFTDCIKIVGEGSFTIYSDPARGHEEVPITVSEWYAPGVGLVKMEREEKMESSVFSGGYLLMELTKFEDDDAWF